MGVLRSVGRDKQPVPEPAGNRGGRDRAIRATRSLISAAVAPIALVALVAVAWQIASRFELVNRFVLPPPSDVVHEFLFLAGEGFFWDSVRATTAETALGFLVGSSLGILLGALTGSVRAAHRILHPYTVLFQSFPKSALAPTLLFWFGFGMASKVVLAATIAFFPVFVNTLSAFFSVGQSSRLLMQSYGASGMCVLRKLSGPASLPAIFAGLKTAVSLALIGAIVAEFVGANRGIGVLIQSFSSQFKIDVVFALLGYLALLGLAFFLVVELLDRKIVFWRGR